MKTVCAWCGNTIREGPGDGGEISHGICSTCRRWLDEEVGGWEYSSALRKMLDRLGKPVLVVGEDVEILYANPSACELLGKKLYQVTGFSGGEAFECSRAKLPGGCGAPAARLVAPPGG